ncbi:MAG: hypothetical protein JOS17DRAFT_761639 [Linnemannia elongata]|nr:MAG: hypothetical protein JOS17DRAFT_761639 [Linnemannia elongata]
MCACACWVSISFGVVLCLRSESVGECRSESVSEEEGQAWLSIGRHILLSFARPFFCLHFCVFIPCERKVKV